MNILLFLSSCALVAGFAWVFWYQGQSALTAWVAILSLLANIFVLKQIEILGLNATASDVFAIGGLLGLNLLQEKFGVNAAKQAIWVSFSCLLFFVVMSQIHLSYQPSAFDFSQDAYSHLLSPAPRIVFASLITFFIVQQFDIQLYRLFRQYLPTSSMLWVSGLAMCLSQLLDTVLFSVLGLYGIVSALTEIMIVSYAIKLIAIANTVPWAFLTKRLFIKN
jgi:uncharacterized integral membrane protein (TIGR00697 family)